MRGYSAFLAKEFTEMVKTRKVLIILAVFILFGIMSPILAKMMPDLLSSMTESMAEEGVVISIAEPTVADSYMQLFKNFTQMGLIVVLLVFSNILSGELSKGTLTALLAKGLRRDSVILAKYTAAVFWWTVGLAAGTGIAYIYTILLFGAHDAHHLVFSVFCLWLFVCAIITLILLSSVIVKGSVGGLAISVGSIILMFIINIFPQAVKYNPIALASSNANIALGRVEYSQVLPAVWVTAALSIVSIFFTIVIFRKKAI